MADHGHEDHEHGHAQPDKPPTTIPSDGAIATLLVLAVLITLAMGFVPYLLLGIPVTLGVIASLVLYALNTDVYLKEVPGYSAAVLRNSFTGDLRVLFPSDWYNFTYPWEVIDEHEGNPFINLRTEFEKKVPGTFAAKDMEMVVQYIFTLRVIWSEDGVLKYVSYGTAAIKQRAEVLLTRLLGDYFRDKTSDELLDKTKVLEEIFKNPESKGYKEVLEFEQKHGVHLHPDLEDVDRTDSAQEAQEIVAKMKYFNQAVTERLKGMGITEPTKEERQNAEDDVRRLMTPDNFQTFDWRIAAPDLKNLEHFSLMGGGMSTPSKGGKGKAKK